jgi:GNAT superfamily N-acetyltransferase
MPSEQINYREEVRASDPQAVREIVVSSGFFRDDEVEIAVELVDERLKRGEASGYFFLFADVDGQTVGYTCFGPIGCTLFSYDMYWIAVREDYRNHGLGKELVRRSEQIIARMGGRRVYVETSSQEKYDPTRAFYLKRDYWEEARLKEFYAPGDDKVIYVKVL